ncbi:MAG: response regulator transcription factor [Solirubrobacteraceae bacterium]
MLTVHPHSHHMTASEQVGREAGYRVLRVLVVDDHPAVRTGVLALLEEQPDLVVIDAVGSAEAAMSLVEREPVDVAVVDYQLGSRSGLWLSRMLKRLDPAPRVVIYSAYCDAALAAACVVAEAEALVSKGGVAAELCDAVRAAAVGQTRLPRVAPRLADAMRRRLEPEDQAIFGMLLAGTDRGEIATTLGISATGLDARMWAMLHKLERLGSDAARPGPLGASSPRWGGRRRC